MTRALRLSACLALLSSLVAGAPATAAAQVLASRAAGVAAVPSGAASAAVRPASLSLPSLNAAPALSASALGAPAFAAPVLAAPSAPASAAAALAAPAAAVPAAVVPAAALAVAAQVAPAAAQAAAPSASRVLREGAARLQAAPRAAESASLGAELDALYSGAAVRSAAADVAAPALRPSAARLAPSSGLSRDLRAETPAPAPAPRSTFKRSLAVGYLTGFAGMAFTVAATTLATFLGWAPHGNYQAPFENMPGGLWAAASILLGASVLAPMAEEVLFRGGLQGGLSKLSSKLHLGSFVVPAVLTSLVFVAVHETADPVLFAVRFGFAFMLSRVFHKEGILASMTAHGTFNGLATMGVVLAAAHVPFLGLLTLPLSIYLAARALKLLKAEKPEIAAGTLAPKAFTAAHAALIIPILLAGFALVMPNVFWLAGAAALAVWLVARVIASFRA